MTRMVYRLVVASLFVAATAFAQAPGEVAPVAPPAAAPAPAPYSCGYPAYEPVMANRWAVGFSIGSVGLAPKNAPDDQSNFGVGEIALRFRMTPHLEIEAAFGGGRETMKDGTQGNNELSMGVIGLRYRFAVEDRWNWWIMGGLGGLSVASHDATDAERNEAERPIGELGVGIERRFHHFALQAELRGIGVGEPKSEQDAAPVKTTAGTSMATTTTQPPAMTAPDQKLSGGQLTIGASYYF